MFFLLFFNTARLHWQHTTGWRELVKRRKRDDAYQTLLLDPLLYQPGGSESRDTRVQPIRLCGESVF